MKELKGQDLLDILQGAAILGGGGGGLIAGGKFYIENVLSKTASVRLVPLQEIEDDTLLCCSWRMGAVADRGEEGNLRSEAETTTDILSMEALRVMEKRVGKNICGFFPIEIGPVNTLLPFCVAASVENGFVVDADTMGRSAPQLKQSILWSSDLPPRTIAVTSTAGETFIQDDITNAEQAEQVLRGLCVKGSCLYGIDHALPKAVIGSKLVPGTVSSALSIGRDLRMAKENGSDAAETIARKYSGKIVFRGVLSSVEEVDRDGFTSGCSIIKGSGEFKGRTYRLDYKNENMVGWLNDTINVTVPEIITVIDDDNDVVLNSTQKVGDVVTVVVLPAPAHYLTEEGLRMFGPSSCGLTQEFKSALTL